MSRPALLWDRAAEVLPSLGGGRRLLAAFDFDGTLAPIAPTPERARPLQGVLEALARLGAQPGVVVAIVTGRRLEDLAACAPGSVGFHRIGGHGAELAGPNEAPRAAPGVDRERLASVIRTLATELSAECAEYPGARLEDKGFGLAVHTRGVEPSLAAGLEVKVRARVKGARARGLPVTLLEGQRVLELRGEGIDKGRGLEVLMSSFCPEVVLYVGDDYTDEDVFLRLHGRAGRVSVRVSSETEFPDTAADFWVHGPEDVLKLILRLIDARLTELREERGSRGNHSG